VQHRFFVDERSARGGISLTDELLALATGSQAGILPREVEARWKLVEVSWGLGLGSRVVSFEMQPDADLDPLYLYAPRRLRRDPVTGVRDALCGYQDGRCAYCGTEFTDIGPSRVAVDHVIPFMLMARGWQDGDLHQVWNFVLACWGCNSDKWDRPPDEKWMPWLEERTEQLIGSHHPLRETLIRQLGKDASERHRTLVRRHNEATANLRPWMPPRLPD
jgi:5-methylcytosine-specific restriction endonuclease McrA